MVKILKKLSERLVKKIKEENEIRQVVLWVENQKQAEGLLYQLLGEKIIAHQIKKITSTGISELIFLLPLEADELRNEIRKIAINYPLRIASYNWEEKFSQWQNLINLKDKFEDRFFFSLASREKLDFIFEQMKTWTGDLVASSQKEKFDEELGSVLIENKYVKTASHLAIKDYIHLTGSYIISQKFLSFAGEKMFLYPQWQKVLAEFAGEQVAKACEFAVSEPLPPVEKENQYCRALAKRWWPEIKDKSVKANLVAATVRIKGEVIVEEDAEIGEYTCIQGPAYIGKKVRIGNFCQLEANTFLEEKVEMGNYCQVGDVYWRDKQVISQLKTKIMDR